MLELGPVAGVSILGSGAAFPAQQLSNRQVLERLGHLYWRAESLTDERLEFLASALQESMGVASRAWAHTPGAPFEHATEESTLTLAVRAARAAVSDAGAPRIGLVICSTSTPYRMTSTTSAVIGAELGIDAACMDLRTGCSAGVFALATAALYVQATGLPVLIVGTETFSKVLPTGHKGAVMSLADGAGAVVFGPGPGSMLAAALGTDGNLAHLVNTPGALPATSADIAAGAFTLAGAPEELAAELPSKYFAAVQSSLARAGLRGADITHYVPHQTSATLIRKVAEQAGIADDSLFINVERHGNIGAAGWLVALHEARSERSMRAGDTLLVAAVGGGMSWASALLRL